MRIRFYSTTICLCLCLGLSSFLSAQNVFRYTSTSIIPYYEYVPQDYGTNSDKYPVVFFLHGIGERTANTTDIATLEAGIWTVAKNGPARLVKLGHEFPFILISIQLKNNYSSWPTWYILEVINHVKTYLRIDERRMHVTGFSMGGGGTWSMATDYPELFATASPMAGGYNSPSKACAIAAENLPIWAVHGDADTVVPYTKTTNMVKAINACSPTPNPQAKVSIYSGVKHNSWERAYTPDNTYHNPNLYQWLMSYTNTITKGNKIPVANAGTDKTITTTSLSLQGAATDADGSITSYQWAKIGGPSCTMTNTSSSNLSLSGMAFGTYMFKLKVTDNSGATDTDYIRVIVDSGQNAPVANAGSDATITLPTSSAILSGSGTDSDGTISSYNWTFVSGPKTPTLTNALTKTLTASSMSTAGNYVFQLEVKDNVGAVGKDQATVVVKNTTNVFPVANAGNDVTITLPTSSVTLAGSATDSDGTISSYNWTFISGPKTPTLTNALTNSLTASALSIAGSYVFQLEVKDNLGAVGKDQVTVVVKSTTNVAPVANAGTDVTITLPTNSAIITGSATDSDGTIASYNWTFISGPTTPALTNALTKTLTATALSSAGSYVFQFEVKDNLGAVGKDQVTVIVKSAVNVAPIANAGADVTITLPTSSTILNGSGTDSDGTIASYNWTFISGPKTPTLTNALTKTLTASAMTTAGSYVFQLEVKDNVGGLGKDQVTVIVKSATNVVPVANAGADVTITLPASSATLNGSGTDSDGTISSYTWTFISGPRTPTLTNALTKTLSVSGLSTAGSYVFKFEVKDNVGAIGSDQVTVVVKNANVAPIANAGSDKTITLPTSSSALTGSGTDTDGTISSYTWTFISGPKSPTLTNALTNTPTASAMSIAGSYVFQLEVKDNLGAIGKDQVTVVVKAANVAPVASAGSDRTIHLPTSSVTLTGSGTDSDGTISSYVWTFVSGPRIPALTNALTSTLTTSGLSIAGNYVFQLEVKDNLAASGKDQVTVIVKNPNLIPVVNAGEDVVVYLPTNSTTLTGTAVDSDGSIASYQWTQISGPKTASLSGASTASLFAGAMTVEGFYVFKLTVTDDSGATAFDKVGVTIRSLSASGTSSSAYVVEDPNTVDLAKDQDPYWQDKTVFIYSEMGARLYAGPWTENSFEEVLGETGMFIFNVTEGNKRVYSGKIVIKD
jgi:predicted esterase